MLLPVAETALLRRWDPGAAALGPQITAPPPLDLLHDLRWVPTYHNSWRSLGLELAAILALRSLGPLARFPERQWVGNAWVVAWPKFKRWFDARQPKPGRPPRRENLTPTAIAPVNLHDPLKRIGPVEIRVPAANAATDPEYGFCSSRNK